MSTPFATRHIGPHHDAQTHMLTHLGFTDMDAFLEQVIPNDIRRQTPLNIGAALSEAQALEQLRGGR